MSLIRPAIVVLSTTALVATGATAAAAAPSSAKHPTEHFVISWADPSLRVITHGPIVGTGKVKDVDAANTVLHLGHGTLTLHTNPKKLRATGGVNAKTCYASYRVSNHYTLGHGTGAYRGVTGHGVIRGQEQALFKRNKHGQCVNGNFRSYTAQFHADGPITVPAGR